MAFPSWIAKRVKHLGDVEKTMAAEPIRTAADLQRQFEHRILQLGLDPNRFVHSIAASQQAGSQPNTPKPEATMLLRIRLGGFSGALNIKKEDFLHAHVLDDAVIVFYIFGGQEGHLRDDVALFPSDTLITQIRMVMS
jgi:hypothetical protein